MTGICAMVCLALGLALAAPTMVQPKLMAQPKLMDWPDLLGRPMPQPTERIAYGPGPLQFAELWLPAGKGPFPVVVMVHGGCWLSGVAKLTIQSYAAEDLRRRGIAVWNLEYRGADRPGGGYPGTFQDVAAGADLLEKIAPSHHLRLDRVVAVGHSAGGHLVFWLAARARLPLSSPLRTDHPLKIDAALSLGGLPDLEAMDKAAACGEGTVARLVGPPGAAHPDVYADTSPAELGAGRERLAQINGDHDGIAPAEFATAYGAKMRRLGARITETVIPDTGHVELISPGTAAWATAVETIQSMLKGD